MAYCSHDDFYGRGFNGTLVHPVLDFKGIKRRRLLYHFSSYPLDACSQTSRYEGGTAIIMGTPIKGGYHSCQ